MIVRLFRMIDVFFFCCLGSLFHTYSALKIGNNKNDLKLRMLFKENCINNNSGFDLGQIPLHVAAEIGNIPLLKLILRTIKYPDARDHLGRAPLHIASSKGLVKVVGLLLSSGADIEATDNWNRTALHEATEKNKLRTIEVLIQGGANVNARDHIGNTPLHLSACSSSKKILEFLLNSFSLTFYKNDLGRTALSMSALCGRHSLFNILKHYDSPDNSADSEGNTIVHLSVIGRSLKILKELHTDNAVFDKRNRYSQTPLHLASQTGQPLIIKYLVSKGADVNAQDSDGNTPLHLAIASGDVLSISCLLHHGVDTELTNNNGITAVEWKYTHLLPSTQTPMNLIQNTSYTSNNSTVGTSIGQTVSLPPQSKITDQLNIDAQKEILQSSINRCLVNPAEGYIKDIPVKDMLFVCNSNLLHLAVSKKNIAKNDHPDSTLDCSSDLVKLFISVGVNVNATDCHGRTPLHIAVENGNLKATKLLVENNADLNKKDALSRSPLFITSEKGHIEILRFFMKKNVSIHTKGYSNYEPIHIAAKNGAVEMLEILVSAGANIEQKSSWYHRRPLHEACNNNKVDSIKFLLSKGADKNSKDLWGRSCLHLSAEHGYVEATEVLLDAKADIDSEMREHKTPLIIAAESGQSEVSEILLKRGADASVKSEDGRSILHLACKGGNVKLVEAILKVYPAINEQDFVGKTPLYWAASFGHFDAFMFLLKSGGEPHIKTFSNMTILHAIAEGGSYETAKVGLNLGININAVDKYGRTAILIAVMYSHIDIFNLFLIHGADPNIKTTNNETLLHGVAMSGNEYVAKAVLNITKYIDAEDSEGMTALHRAVTLGRNRIFEILYERGAKPCARKTNGDSVLHTAAHFGIAKIVQKILEKTDCMNFMDKKGRTPIYVAAERGKSIVFFILAQKGARSNTTTYDGKTLLHGATIGMNLEILQYALNLTKSINLGDNAGRTPLFYSAALRSKRIFDYLLSKGADPKIRTNEHVTLLHAAAGGGDLRIVEEVFSKTRNPNVRDSKGKTPIFYAVERNHRTVFDFFLSLDLDLSPARGGWTLLHSAAKGGDVYILSRTLTFTKNIDAQYEDGATALFVSVENYKKEAFSLLLKRNANVTIPKNGNYTILHWSSKYGDVDIAQRVLQIKQDPLNVQDYGGRTPIHWAVYNGHIAVVRVLLQYNASVYIKNVFGYTPIMMSAAKGSISMIRTFAHIEYNGEEILGVALAWGNREVMKYLIDNKVIPDERNKLHYAAARGDNDELKRLFRSHANAKPQAFFGITREIARDYIMFTASMVDDGVHLINPMLFKLTPLHMAIFFNGSVETVEIILNMTHFNPTNLIKQPGKWTPLDMAAFCGKNDLVRYFIHIGVPASLIGKDSWTSIHKAAWGGHKSTVKLLYDSGVDINRPDAAGRTALHVAAMRGHNETVHQILQLSSDCINTHDRYKFTPLHLAEIYGHERYFQAIALGTLTMDAQIRYALKDYGLLTSILRNHTAAVEQLLEAGADPNVQDLAFGWTVLHWSAAIGHLDVARLLLKYGARVNLPSKTGQTPMFLARFWGRVDVYHLLRENDGVW